MGLTWVIVLCLFFHFLPTASELISALGLHQAKHPPAGRLPGKQMVEGQRVVTGFILQSDLESRWPSIKMRWIGPRDKNARLGGFVAGTRESLHLPEMRSVSSLCLLVY